MIILYDNLYVGRIKRPGENILGFMVPDGTDKGAEGRKKTVDDWAKPSRRYQREDDEANPALEPLLLENKALDGYRLADTIFRSGWGGDSVHWRVYDPRGFELEITVGNLAMILDFCGVQAGGAINGPCIWGREGNKNILLPIGSQGHKDAHPEQRLADQKGQLDVGYLYDHTKLGQLTYLGKVQVTRPQHADTVWYGFVAPYAHHRKSQYYLYLLKSKPKVGQIGVDSSFKGPEFYLELAKEDLGRTVDGAISRHEIERLYPAFKARNRDYHFSSGSWEKNRALEAYSDHLEKGHLIWFEREHPLWSEDREERAAYHERPLTHVGFPYSNHMYSSYVTRLESVPEK